VVIRGKRFLYSVKFQDTGAEVASIPRTTACIGPTISRGEITLGEAAELGNHRANRRSFPEGERRAEFRPLASGYLGPLILGDVESSVMLEQRGDRDAPSRGRLRRDIEFVFVANKPANLGVHSLGSRPHRRRPGRPRRCLGGHRRQHGFDPSLRHLGRRHLGRRARDCSFVVDADANGCPDSPLPFGEYVSEDRWNLCGPADPIRKQARLRRVATYQTDLQGGGKTTRKQGR
jgi:hypothetical protein